jgi:hypothetical protein
VSEKVIRMAVQKPELDMSITVKMRVSVWKMQRVWRGVADLAICHRQVEFTYGEERSWRGLWRRQGVLTVTTEVGRRAEVVTRVRQLFPGASISYGGL